MKRFLLLFILWPFPLFAQKFEGVNQHSPQYPFVIYSDSIEELDLTSSVSVINETTGYYSPQQITSGSLDPLFHGNEIPDNVGHGYDRYLWVRINIRSQIDRNTEWILKTDKKYSEVTAYIVAGDGKTSIQKSGWSQPPAKRSVNDPDVIFRLLLKEKEQATVYLHIHTDLRWSKIDKINVKLIPETYWYRFRLRNYSFLSVYAGICLLAVFYWLITYIFSRRVNYLYLIVATLSALIFCLDIYGITAIFWSDDPWYRLVKYGQQFLWLPLMVISHFAISYKANSFITHFSKPVIFFYWLTCIITVVLLFVTPFILQWKYANAISLSMILLSMGLGVMLISSLLLKKGFGSTAFAFLAILPIFIGTAVYIFSSLGILSDKYKLLTPTGALLTVIMYFYGMVHYVSILRHKRKQEILKNDMLIRKQNIMLEKTVEERTTELKITNEELSLALQHLQETHVQLMEAEKLKADEKINTLLKDQELKSVSDMLDVQEGERKRIATDLHDRLGSMLSTVKLYFGTVEEQVDKLEEKNKEQYNKANILLDEACEEVRKISHDLVSGELVKFGLVSALRQLAKTIEDTGQVKIKVMAFGMGTRLESNIEITLYRVIQELMNNVLKHSKATEITIQLNKVENNLNIVVEDNGVGFDIAEAKNKDGMGLKNLDTRVSKLNGIISFDSGKGRGTTTIIDIPV